MDGHCGAGRVAGPACSGSVGKAARPSFGGVESVKEDFILF